MANLIHSTENFASSYWESDPGGVATVTVNTHAAPAFAGPSAGMADTITDDNDPSVVAAFIRAAEFPGVPGGGGSPADYRLSVYIRKDAGATNFFPILAVQWLGGTGGSHGVSIDIANGDLLTADGYTAPASSEIESIDATWWRVKIVANSGNNADFWPYIYPAPGDVQGDPNDSTVTGSIVVWGINFTPASDSDTYVPDPFYSFSTTNPFFTSALPVFR